MRRARLRFANREIEFVDRDIALRQVEEYAEKGTVSPIVIYGPEGCGKAALLRQAKEALEEFGYSVEPILPEPAGKTFWVSNAALQLSMYVLLAASAFVAARLRASKALGRPVCVTYESSTAALLTLIILDRPSYAEGLIIPRGQRIEALVPPAPTILAVNALAFAIDALAASRGRGRLGGLRLCVGQTPVWKPKADSDVQRHSPEQLVTASALRR